MPRRHAVKPIRLVLASAPVGLSERYGAFAGAASTQPSFGIVCLAAAAQQMGAEVNIVEASAENLSCDQTVNEIRQYGPEVTGISATTVGIVAAGELARRLKALFPQMVVVIGGCHVSAIPAETLESFPAFDLAVIGEGERTLVEILRRVADGGGVPSGLEGTAERVPEGIRINPPRPLIESLDELPLPPWSLLRGFPKAFRPSPARVRRSPCASIVLTRGCPNDCSFCDRSVYGRRCRSYSPQRAVGLVHDLRQRYGVREVLLEDDTFVLSKDRVREFCERLMAAKIDVTWSCLGRADRVTPDLLGLMRKAGCWHISFGIESGDPGILRSVCKNLDLEQVRQAVRWSREAGLRTKGFFMVGFPGETAATLKATRDFARSLPLDDITVAQLTPFPGSRIYATADQEGTFDRDWRKMNILNTVFVPNGLTRESLDAARSQLLREFYLRPGVIGRHLLNVIRNPRIASSMLRGLAALWRTT